MRLAAIAVSNLGAKGETADVLATFCSAEKTSFCEDGAMLVLTRKQGEQIMVGDGIRLTVLAIEGNRVRLGLLAPPEVTILSHGTGAAAQARERAVCFGSRGTRLVTAAA